MYSCCLSFFVIICVLLVSLFDAIFLLYYFHIETINLLTNLTKRLNIVIDVCASIVGYHNVLGMLVQIGKHKIYFIYNPQEGNAATTTV